MPLMPNPANSATEPLAARALLASSRRSRSTIVGRYALSAASKNVVSTAASAATARSCHRASVPNMNEMGITLSTAARPRSAQINTGRRRSRSTHAPATSPTMSAATRSMLRRTATSIGPASRVRMATRGRAIRVISEPKIEMLAAVQTRTKALLLQSGDVKGLRTNAEHTVRRVPPDPALHCARSVRQNSRTTRTGRGAPP